MKKFILGFLGVANAVQRASELMIRNFGENLDQTKVAKELYSKFDSSQSAVHEVRSDEDIDKLVRQLEDGEQVVLKSYLHWCGHCTAFVSAMRMFSLAMNDQSYRKHVDASKTIVAAIDCAQYKGEYCKFKGYPHFSSISKDAKAIDFTFERLKKHWEGNDACDQAENMVEALLNHAIDKHSVVEHAAVQFSANQREQFCESKVISEERPTNRWPANSGVWAMNDAEASLLASFNDIKNVMNLAQSDVERANLAQTAKTFINVVVQTLPFPDQDKTNLLLFAEDLSGYDALDGNINTPLPQLEMMSTDFRSNSYKACSSDKKFSCGLWKLFHLVAHHACDNSESPMPYQIMEAFHGFIQEFFQCNECKANFLKVYDEETRNDRNLIKMDATQCDRRPLRLWLWKLHNDITARVFAERWGANHNVDTRWPSTSQCASCRDANGDMIESEVLKYMENTASQGDLAFDKF